MPSTTLHANSTAKKKYDPPRQIGRVSDENWEKLKSAAQLSEESFTRWALRILLPEAERINNRFKNQG